LRLPQGFYRVKGSKLCAVSKVILRKRGSLCSPELVLDMEKGYYMGEFFYDLADFHVIDCAEQVPGYIWRDHANKDKEEVR
jgi:hypothetical protein